MSVRIWSDDTLAKRVLALLRTDYERQEAERGDKIHVSDLIFPRRTWLSQINPKPLTDEDLLYFTAGRAHHEIIGSLLSKKEMREVKVEYEGIVGSVDVIDADGTPVEVKTTRVKEPYAPVTVPNHFVFQLGCYTSMLVGEDVTVGQGQLLLFYLGVRDKGRTWRNLPRLESFGLEFDNLPKIRSTMLSRKAMLEGFTIPSTETCHSWLCRFCKWYKDPCLGWGSDLEARLNASAAGASNILQVRPHNDDDNSVVDGGDTNGSR